VGAYEYAQLANEASEMRGESPIYDKVSLGIIKNHLDPDIYPDVNWQDEVIKKNSLSRNYYVSARGGANVAKYFLSLGANIEDAAYKVDKSSPYASNVGYNRYTYRTNLDIKLTPTSDVYFGADGALTTNSNPGVANTDYIWAAQSEINPLRLPTVYSNGQYPAVGTNAGTSPYVLINKMGRRYSTTYDSKVTLAFEQKLDFITKGLKIRAQGAYDMSSYYNESRLVMPALYQAVGRAQNGDLITIRRVDEQSASFTKNTNQYRKYHFESTLNYERLFGEDHRVSGLIYYYMSDEKWSEKATTNMSSVPYRYQGISSRLTYGYKDTYMMDFNFGYTGSENFQKGNRFGFFPSVAVGWIPTNYKWVKDNLSFLDFLKIRTSYGTVGNDRISDSRFPYRTIVSRQSNTPFGSAQVETLEETYIGASNLKWERAKKFDLGFEGRLFHEALQFTVDFFHDTRDGIFMLREDIPEYVGLVTNPYTNIGKMVSMGADGNVSYTHQFNKDMDFTVRGNFTYSRNDVKNWSEEAPAYPYQMNSGYPYACQRGYISLGLFKDQTDIDTSPVQSFGTVMPGDIKYKDINGDGQINDYDKVVLAYQNYPLLMYGFGGEFRYKAFTVGIMFKGRGRTDYFKNGMGYIPFYEGVTGNVLTQVADPRNRWFTKEYAASNGIDVSLAENPNAMYPRMEYGKNENNSQVSTFWMGDAKYLRLQEVTLSYNLKEKFLRSMGITSMDIQLIGENLCVWDKVKLFDPEQAQYNGRAYPIPSTYTLQLYLHF
jgi:TonB-linked SusC/RagA family outer membrane protein